MLLAQLSFATHLTGSQQDTDEMPNWRSSIMLSHWSSSAIASEDQSCLICSMPSGLLQSACPRVWGSGTLMGPLHSFSVTHSLHKSLFFSSPDAQIFPEHFQHSFSCECEWIHLCYCPRAPWGLHSGESCAGFHTKHLCCNTASNLHSWESLMVLVQLLKRSVLSSTLCQASVVFEEDRIGWRWWVVWSGIR